jgi:hypothetical protein
MIKTLMILLTLLIGGYNLHAQVFPSKQQSDSIQHKAVKVFFLQYTVIQILIQLPANERHPGFFEPAQVRDALQRSSTDLQTVSFPNTTVSKTNIIVYPGLLIW